VNPSTAWFGRLDSDGNQLWDETWAGDSYAIANDLAVDSTGRIVVVGSRNILNQGIRQGQRFQRHGGRGHRLARQRDRGGVVEQDADWDVFVAKYGP
jgi:hypothetical protein